jgi:hypothetical protein
LGILKCLISIFGELSGGTDVLYFSSRALYFSTVETSPIIVFLLPGFTVDVGLAICCESAELINALVALSLTIFLEAALFVPAGSCFFSTELHPAKTAIESMGIKAKVAKMTRFLLYFLVPS